MKPDSVTMEIPPELVSVVARLMAAPTTEDRRRTADAVSAVLSAIEGRAVTQEAEAKFRPHPMDLLILTVVQERGVASAADIFAEIEDETFTRRGGEATPSFTTLNRRLRAMTEHGILRRTAEGYAVADESRAKIIDDVDFGG